VAPANKTRSQQQCDWVKDIIKSPTSHLVYAYLF